MPRPHTMSKILKRKIKYGMIDHTFPGLKDKNPALKTFRAGFFIFWY